jgi:hypothetical protein
VNQTCWHINNVDTKHKEGATKSRPEPKVIRLRNHRPGWLPMAIITNVSDMLLPKKKFELLFLSAQLTLQRLSKLFCLPYSALITKQLLHEWSSMYISLHCRISIVFGFLAPIKELFPTLGCWSNRHPKVHYKIPYFIPCSRNGPSESTSNNSTHVAITKVRFMESKIYLLQFSCLFLLIDVRGIHILLLCCGTQFYIREMIGHFLTLFTWLIYFVNFFL